MSDMGLADRLEMLEEAYEALKLAVQNISAAVRGTSEEGRSRAYIIPHLRSWMDQESNSISKIMQALEEGGDSVTFEESSSRRR